jgi:hypothetical protein
MAPPVLCGTRARTKAASPPRPPSLQSGATEEAAEDSSDDRNESSRPEASDNSDDVAHSRALSEEEDFSPAEELLPVTRKHPSKVVAPTPNTIQGLPKKKKKLVRVQHTDKHPSMKKPLHLPALGQLRITLSKNTFWINKRRIAVPGLKMIKEAKPNPITPVEITPLGSIPDVSGRHFKFSVECCDIETDCDSQLGGEVTPSECSTRKQQGLMIQYRAIMKTWRIFVWNDALPKGTQKRLRLFPKFALQRSRRYGTWYRVKAKKAKPANPPLYSGRLIVRRGPLESKNEFDSSENSLDSDWYDTLEDDHGFVELEEDDLVDKPDRSGNTGGTEELVINDQGRAQSELLSLQGDAIVAKEELFSDIMAHASLLPKNLQQSFVDKLLRYATWDSSVETAASTSVPASKPVAASASSSRLGLFKEAITYMIIDHRFDSFMRIETLANASLDEWRQFHDDIQAPFTADEILTFCHEMKEKTNFE